MVLTNSLEVAEISLEVAPISVVVAAISLAVACCSLPVAAIWVTDVFTCMPDFWTCPTSADKRSTIDCEGIAHDVSFGLRVNFHREIARRNRLSHASHCL